MQQPQAAPATSGWMKLAVGCAVGCGVVIVVALLAGGLGGWGLVAPGEQRRTAAVTSPASSGSFQVGDLGGDPGVIAVFDRLILESQRQQQQDMPPWLAGLQRAGAGGASPSTGIRMMLPREATVSFEPSATGGDPEVVVAVNARGLTRLLDMMLTDGVVGSHRGHEIARIDDDGWGAFAGGTFLFATEEAALRAAIDRLEDQGTVAATPARSADLGSPHRGWDVTGFVSNDDGAVEGLLWEDGGAPPGILETSFGVDLETGDRAAGRVVADCESEAAAMRALHDRMLGEARDLDARGLELLAGVRTEGKRAFLDWQVDGIAGAVAAWVASNGAAGPMADPYDAELDDWEQDLEVEPTPVPE
jgi:hypothetical protein